MQPEDINRRDIVKTLVLTPLLPLSAAAAVPYAPKFFSPAELELVATLGELVIPQTDTPGARAARTHEHIDLVLSESLPDVQHDFRDGLDWLTRRSRDLHNRPFLDLSAAQQTALLTQIAAPSPANPEDDRGHRFFLDLRSRVVFAYYTSEIGLIQELTYKGKQVLGHWEGCPHPDHHGDAA